MSNGEMATSFEMTEAQINSIRKSKNQSSLLLKIPTLNGSFLLDLEIKNIFSQGFQITEKQDHLDIINKSISLGKFYEGNVKGIPNSMVTLNINSNKISGVIRTAKDIYNIIYDFESRKQILFSHNSISDIKPFTCDQIESAKKHNFDTELKSSNTCTNAVTIYFECDYDMYLNLNSNVQEVVDYVTNVFNEVNTIYTTENIPVLISQISVWTTDDPYTDSKLGIYDFADSLILNSFPGDVAQLLTNDPGTNGGTAYVDQLCGLLPFSYCDIVNSNEVYPTYSWDVQVIAHELGHTFGSQHTHDCVWGPNDDSQIDDCGNVANGTGDICYDSSIPIIPIEGGTIMSYCHVDPVGIDFLNGFGSEPGALIRLNHQFCFCDNSQCYSATELNASGSYYAHPSDGNGASANNASHADWFVFEPTHSGTISLESCGENVDTRVWIWEGECDILNYAAISDDDCESGNGSNFASQIVDFPVEANKKYYFEWDNRWSNNEFNWFFVYDHNLIPLCDSIDVMSTGIIIDSLNLHAQIQLQTSNTIMNNAPTNFKAGGTIDLLPGFELSLGATLELSIENCNNEE